MAGEKERVDSYLGTLARMEPNIAMVDRDAALASIAISLKRIADLMENNQIQEAVYNATYNALHQHWRDRA